MKIGEIEISQPTKLKLKDSVWVIVFRPFYGYEEWDVSKYEYGKEFEDVEDKNEFYFRGHVEEKLVIGIKSEEYLVFPTKDSLSKKHVVYDLGYGASDSISDIDESYVMEDVDRMISEDLKSQEDFENRYMYKCMFLNRDDAEKVFKKLCELRIENYKNRREEYINKERLRVESLK